VLKPVALWAAGLMVPSGRVLALSPCELLQGSRTDVLRAP
jgi:hypothetical protein